MAGTSNLAVSSPPEAAVQQRVNDCGLADETTIGTMTAQILYALADSGMTDVKQMMLIVEMRLASV